MSSLKSHVSGLLSPSRTREGKARSLAGAALAALFVLSACGSGSDDRTDVSAYTPVPNPDREPIRPQLDPSVAARVGIVDRQIMSLKPVTASDVYDELIVLVDDGRNLGITREMVSSCLSDFYSGDSTNGEAYLKCEADPRPCSHSCDAFVAAHRIISTDAYTEVMVDPFDP